jgi:acetyltransferase-like isoleucine patch superfamily enzyme
MGAGSITSNVRADKSKITVHAEGGLNIETGLRKFGAILGDYAEIGCNAVLNPGSVVGRYSRVYPTSNVRGVIPAYSIYKINGAIAAIRAGNSEG